MSKIIGIDVSEHNGTLDWAKIKKAGIEFAIIRTGYGTSHVDTQFKNNMKGAIEQGIHIGAYHFSYALNESGAKNEADFVTALLQPYKDKIDMPVFFDFEYDTVSYAKKQGVALGKEAFNNHTVAFCEQIKKAGYTPGTYYNLSYLNSYVDKSKIGKYVKWFAQYASAPGTSDYALWQYSSSYKISGLGCKFDVNILKDTSIINKKVASGWKESSKGKYYVYADGTNPVSTWKLIDGEFYYFNKEGFLVCDQIVSGANSFSGYDFYCGEDGKVVKNTTITVNGVSYSADSDGRLEEINFEEEDDMTYDKFKEYMNQYFEEIRSLDGHAYSQEARDWSVETGIIKGTSHSEFDGDWQDYVTREMMVTMLKRFKDLLEQ